MSANNGLPSAVELDVVIPLYNEESILRDNAEKLSVHLDRVIGRGKWRFIFVDNGSADRTRAIIHELIKEFDGGLYVHESEPNYGRALRAGLKAASSPYVHTCDVEQWDIPFLAWAWSLRKEHDYFVGSRRSDPTIYNAPFLRRFLSWGLNALIQLFFSYMGTDTHGPKLFNLKRLQPIIDICVCDRGQFDSEIVLRAVRGGLRIAEAPIEHAEHRPPRFAIVKKIGWNIIAFIRLNGVLRNVPYSDTVNFHQFSRTDVLQAYKALGDSDAAES